MIPHRQVLISATALLSAAFAAQAADAKPAPAKTDGGRVALHLQDAAFEIRSRFDEEGVHRGVTSNLRLSLNVNYPLDLNIVGVSELRITEALLDSGESVVPRNPDRDRNRGNFNNDKDRHYGYAQIPLASPGRPFTSIKSVAGTIVFSVAGPAKDFNLKPLANFLGKGLALDGLNGAEVTIERDKKGKGITLSFPKNLEERLKEVSFADAAGRPIRSNGWGGSSDDGDYTRTYHVTVADDGGMTLSFLGDLSTVETPVSFKDIPMAVAKSETKEKVKVKVSPNAEPEKVEAQPPKPKF